MTDYSQLGLNSSLQPINSPVTNSGFTASFIDSYTYNSTNDRNAVSIYNIKNFSFNAGTGGTLTLGGLNDGNGILQIKDSGGTQRVVLNNEGITVNDGSIVIKNSLGSVIMNQTGLTTYNFKSDSRSESTVVNTAGTTYSTIGSVTLDFDLNKKCNVLFLASTMARNTLGSTNSTFRIGLYKSTDGTSYSLDTSSQTWYIYEPLGEEFTNKFQSGMLFYEIDASGTYNYWRSTLEWMVSAGTAYCYNRQLNYVVLGS